MLTHLKRTTAVIAAAAIAVCSASAYYAHTLPDSYYISAEEGLTIQSALPVTAAPVKADAMEVFSGTGSNTSTVSLRLFGVIPIKDAEVQEIETPLLIPGGQPFGIKLRMDGAMVIRLGKVETENGSVCPAEEAKLKAGDIIQSIDGFTITSGEALSEALESSSGDTVTVKFTRSDKQLTTELTPVYSESEGGYAAGMWVRDSLAGVGTMTYYDPDTMTFGGLGHPICDGDTGVCIPIGEGCACPVTISSLVKGTAGKPGMLEGTFLGGGEIGSLLCNNRCGIFGRLSDTDACLSGEAVPMAFKQEIETGSAEIICTTNGEEPERYTIEIEETDLCGSDNTKNMIIRITDKELLEETGGIVQGMSGSPIIQNGKLAGAVTHVFVDDPTRGYAIFCENMYRQSASLGR